MDLESIMLIEVRQRKINTVITYMWNLKIKQIKRNKNRLPDIQSKLVVTSGEREAGRGKIGVGD